jgi:hypothetical protein
VDARTRNALVRWLLLTCVAFGIVVMHHVTADHPTGTTVHLASHMAGAPMGHPAPVPVPPPDVLHQCMAVVGPNGVTAIVLLLLVGVVVLLTPRGAGLRTTPGLVPARPPSGLAGRALLQVVCVARR